MEIKELENLIDDEIEQYKLIEKLYIEKKEILMRAKPDELLQIDSKILDVVQNISIIETKRKAVSEKLNIMTPTMSEIIGYLKAQDPEAAKRFEEKKLVVKELSEKLKTLEETNLALTKHGIQFTNKTLEVILKGAGLSTQEYNEYGKNISNGHLEMSSIVKEA